MLDNASHDVLALTTGSRRQRCPGGTLAVTVPKPFERTDRGLLVDDLDRRPVDRCEIFSLELGTAKGRPDADSQSMPAADVPYRPPVPGSLTLQTRRARSGH